MGICFRKSDSAWIGEGYLVDSYYFATLRCTGPATGAEGFTLYLLPNDGRGESYEFTALPGSTCSPPRIMFDVGELIPGQTLVLPSGDCCGSSSSSSSSQSSSSSSESSSSVSASSTSASSTEPGGCGSITLSSTWGAGTCDASTCGSLDSISPVFNSFSSNECNWLQSYPLCLGGQMIVNVTRNIVTEQVIALYTQGTNVYRYEGTWNGIGSAVLTRVDAFPSSQCSPPASVTISAS